MSLLKNYIGIFLTLSVFILGLLSLSAISVQAGPKVEIPNHEFNFGKTVQRVGLTHTFWVKSVGDDTLRITKIVPGCGCTQAPIGDSVLAPGDSTRLDITLSTGSYRGFLSKKPYLLTNAGEEKVYVKIHAQIFPNPDEIGPIKIYPLAVDISQVEKDVVCREGRFHIQNLQDRDFEIALEDISTNNFDVKLPKKVKAGETIDGIVTVHGDALDKAFFESITFRIDDNEMSTFSIAVGRRLIYKENPNASQEPTVDR
ncbi:MAG: DUF1573 domain-containing protein [candidate division Zixibacteria bacterium]|nr:DUF1573 domain-containing protein [candidate division Zixibacteria bacterium]